MVRFVRVEGSLHGSSGGGPVIYSNGDKTDEESAGGDEGIAGSDEDSDESRGMIDDEGEGDDRPRSDSRGVIRMSKAGGDVRIGDAPHGATITTGGGDIHVGRAAGRVEVNTGGGDITLGPVAGSVRAGTGAGDVHVTLSRAGGEKQAVDVTSGTGDVVIELPENPDVRLDLETAYTSSFRRPARIVSDWPLERDPVTGWDDRHGTSRRYVRAHGSIGGGRGLVRIHTVNGDIEIRKSRQ